MNNRGTARQLIAIVRRGLGRAALMGLAVVLVVAGVALTATRSGSGIVPSGKASVRESAYGVDVPPTPVDDTYTVTEDSGTTDLDVRQNDIDPDGGANGIAGPERFHSLHGTVHLPPGRSFAQYTPNDDYCNSDPGQTPDSFTYNYGTRATATVTINVTCVNDPPDFAHGGTFTYVENDPPHQASTTVTLRDPEHDSVTGGSATIGTGYAAGQDKLTWADNDPTDPITLDSSSDARHVVLTGRASAGRYRDALRAVRYENTSDAPSTTTRKVTFRATDVGGATGQGTAVIPVTPVNDTPAANDDGYATSQDTALSVSIPASGLLANDTDPDGDALTAVSYTDPAHGTLSHGSDGTFVYTPAAGFHGQDTFTYKAHDATLDSPQAATVTITVAQASQPPAASDDAHTVAEDSGASSVDVLANDTDGTSVARRVASTGTAAHGTVAITHGGADLTYTPNADYCNTLPGAVPDSFTYTLDGGSTATVSMTVTCVEDAPVAGDDAAATDEDTAVSGNVLGNDRDADGDSLSAVVGGAPAHGTLALSADGSFTYTPAHDFAGSDSFTYSADDGSAKSAPATVRLTVRPVDDAPVAVDDSARVAQDADPTPVDVLANDTDVDGGARAVTAASDPPHGQVTVASDGSRLDYLPDAGYCNDGQAPDTFTYTLTGGAQATVSVAVTCAIASGPPPAPIGRLAIGHPSTSVTKKGTLVRVACAGPGEARCRGTLTLHATALKSRLRLARRSADPALSFSLAGGERKTARMPLPAATRAQLDRRRKAIVEAVGRLSDGSTVTRLLTVYRASSG